MLNFPKFTNIDYQEERNISEKGGYRYLEEYKIDEKVKGMGVLGEDYYDVRYIFD